MSHSVKKLVPVAGAICCIFVAYALAQPGQQTNQPGQPVVQPGQPGQPVPPNQPTERMSNRQMQGTQTMRQGANQEVERFLASCLLEKNQAEVEISRIAAERSQNPQVKQFAQQMVNDHQQAVQQLQQVAGRQGSMNERDSARISSQYEERQQPAGGVQTPDRPTTETNRSTSATVSTQDRTRGQDSALDELASIEKKIVEQSTQSLRQKLEQKQGAEFDHCYIGAQVGQHMHMAAALEVIQDEASGQLRQLAQQHLTTVKQHLEHAERLADQLMTTGTRQAGVPGAIRDR
jgi:predicted outer membrane protein